MIYVGYLFIYLSKHSFLTFTLLCNLLMFNLPMRNHRPRVKSNSKFENIDYVLQHQFFLVVVLNDIALALYLGKKQLNYHRHDYSDDDARYKVSAHRIIATVK